MCRAHLLARAGGKGVVTVPKDAEEIILKYREPSE
jgi:hypothetical protein